MDHDCEAKTSLAVLVFTKLFRCNVNLKGQRRGATYSVIINTSVSAAGDLLGVLFVSRVAYLLHLTLYRSLVLMNSSINHVGKRGLWDHSSYIVSAPTRDCYWEGAVLR